MRVSSLFRPACALALAASLLVGCELAPADTDASVAPSAFDARSASVSLEAYAAELNESEQGEAFYFALQYAATGLHGPALYAQFAPAEMVEAPEALRAAFCEDLGDGADLCHELSAQADLLAADAGLDLVALGVAAVDQGVFDEASAGFDMLVYPPCPPPPDDARPAVEALPTYYPNAAFAVEPAFDGEQAVLALQFEPCAECAGPAERLDATLHAFTTLAGPKCPKTGCKCEVPPPGA